MGAINWNVVMIGVFILLVGIAMPAETTDTEYVGGEIIRDTTENDYKHPLMVVGGGLIVVGLFANPTSDEKRLDSVDD